MLKKIFYIAPLFVVLLGFGLHILKNKKESPISPINPNGATISPIKIDFYSQGDSRWAKKNLGSTSDIMSNSGCTVCCIAMVLSTKNIRLQPDELNDKLLSNEGFTKNGWVKWEKIQPTTSINVGLIFNSHQNIVSSLNAGHPVIAKVFLYGTVQHWVLIIGMKSGRYLIADPLDNSISEKYIDQLSEKIYSTRTIK